MHHSANVTLSNRTGPNRVAPHITAPNKAAMLLTSTDARLNNNLGRQLGEGYSHKWEPRQGSPGGPREPVLGSATVRTLCLQPCHAIIAIYYHFTPDYTSRMTTILDTNSTAFFSPGWLWGRGTSDAQINHICWYQAQVLFFLIIFIHVTLIHFDIWHGDVHFQLNEK